MTITISEKAFDELFQETVEPCQHPDPDDVLDVVYKLPQWHGQGYWRDIQLRQGLELTIGNFQLCDRTDVTFEFLYSDQTRPLNLVAIPSIGRKFADIPYDRILGEPDDFAFRNELSASYRLEHRFSKNWTLPQQLMVHS